MEVILLEKIDNVGGIGDRVKVKSGFARNFLIPQGKATTATAQNIQKFEKIRADLEAKAAAEVEAARARASEIEGKELNIAVQAGSEGRLFGSVGTIDIAEALEALGVQVERSEIRLPDGPLRVVGEHEVEIHLHADVNVPLKVVLEGPEGVTAPTVEAEAEAPEELVAAAAESSEALDDAEAEAETEADKD
jgi:large subunit ribosomal protein L9